MSSTNIVLDVGSHVILHSVVSLLELGRATIQSLTTLLSSYQRARLEDCATYCFKVQGWKTTSSRPLETLCHRILRVFSF